MGGGADLHEVPTLTLKYPTGDSAVETAMAETVR